MKQITKWIIPLFLTLALSVGFLLSTEIPTEMTYNPMRAIWIRPKETTTAQVEAHVQQAKDAGLNTIFLETLFHGYTIFPVEYEATYQNPRYQGFDVLQAYIDACHSRGMQLHCWVESFYVGNQYVSNGGPIARTHQDWLLTNTQGENWEDTQYGKMYFFNPARPECREWLVGLYEILCTNYDIDGIQLDYVRYPEKTEEIDYGYDEYTLNGFFTPGNSEVMTLTQYKQQMVTEYVKMCSERLRAIKPDLIISLSVYPFFEAGENTYMQCAQEWMDKGYGDLLVPMAYYENLVESLTTDAIAVSKSAKNTVIGISSQSGFTLESLKAQAELVIETGAGVAIFEYESFFADYADTWRNDVFSDTIYDIDPSVYATRVEKAK